LQTLTKHIVLRELGLNRHHRIVLPCVAGRGKDADLTFPDPSLSHRHALILEEADQIWIEDLVSLNGVYVNGKKIDGKALLRWGDVIQIGQTGLLLSHKEENDSQQMMILHSLDRKAERNPDHERLELIYEITTELSENQDLDLLGERIFARLKSIFVQDRSCLALFLEDGTLKPFLADGSSKSIPLSRSIVNRVFQNGESLLLEDAISDHDLKNQESVIALRIRSALCAPLIYHNQIYGLIYLDRNVPGAYKREDLEFLKAVALILAPLIENARLWSELRRRYADTMEDLRETQARLIQAERQAAYVRLAQAISHEIRNPLMSIGGLARRMDRSERKDSKGEELRTIMTLAQRIEAILKEVDEFVKIQPPQKRLARIDDLIQEVIESCDWDSLGGCLPPHLSIETPHLMVPLDCGLFKKALSMIFQEILPGIPRGSGFKIHIRDVGNDLEILLGEIQGDKALFEPSDRELQHKPWSLSLFLNIAYKIVSDHGGKLLLDPEEHMAFPVLMKIPRTISV
jgi:K+-sensing histidine kinase KdpD